MGTPSAAQPQQSAKTADDHRELLRFASDAAHELVGPVDQTSSLVALFVRRYRGRLDEEADGLLSHIEAAGARMARTAKGLRAYFRVASSEREKSLVDMSAAVASALFLLDRDIKESQAAVSANQLPAAVGDTNLLTLLFQILIENAIKFHRPEVTPRVVVSGEAGPVSSVYSVADNGIGLDPQYRETAFTAFKKLNGHSYPGAGMGLTMARAIVEMHNGRIWIDAPEPTGITVYFELPQ